MGKSRGHLLKLIFTKVGGGSPPWERGQLAPAVPGNGRDLTLPHRLATTVAAATGSSATQQQRWSTPPGLFRSSGSSPPHQAAVVAASGHSTGR